MSDINERIAAVKGWGSTTPPAYYLDQGANPHTRDWEHSISDAWELVDELARTPEEWAITLYGDGFGECRFMCRFKTLSSRGNFVYGTTASRAICLAWLAVMEQDNG